MGIGSAFNTELNNTSVFVKNNNSWLFIDCGGTVFLRLQELSIFDGGRYNKTRLQATI